MRNHFKWMVCLGALLVLNGARAQLAHQAHVTSLGGGIATGGTFASAVVVGDPAASRDLGQVGETTLYPGFVPGSLVVLSFGLKKDSAVLAALYQVLGGPNWNTNTGWLQNADIDAWHGITVQNQRVTRLELQGNNLQNQVPELIRNLSKLEVINLANNEVSGFPDVSAMPNLNTLNVAENRLGFDALLPNQDVSDFVFAPQKRYGANLNDTLEAGTSVVLQANIPGAGNVYQWVFDDLPLSQAVPLTGANQTNLELTNLDFASMGSYRLQARNEAFPGMVIETRNQNIWVATDVFGKVVVNAQGAPLTNGQVRLYRIYDGPFALSDSAALNASGEYLIDNVVLGDFILLVRNNPDAFPNVLQTYYVSTDDWLSADTLFLRERAEGIDIQMAQRPPVNTDPTGATIGGVIETELSETDTLGSDRITARRKVQKAACSIRRFMGSGRDQDDDYILFAYVESDDEGRFQFAQIPEGRYRINIQYPGVPMDPNSDIEFEIGGDVENQVFELDVEITETGIVVAAREVLSTPKPYLKHLKLYPNPTKGPLEVQFLVYRKLEDLKMELYTLQGSRLIQIYVGHQMGWQQASLNMERYPAGVYYLRFSDTAGSFQEQVKIVKE